MQIHHIGYGIRGFYRLAKLGQLWDMIPKEAQYRLKVLRFWKKYGLEATREAFGVSRRTLYRWQEKLRDGMRRYILTMVDPLSRVASARGIPGKKAKYTAKVLKALVEGNPGMRVYWTYPKSPKMNAHNEVRQDASGAICGLS